MGRHRNIEWLVSELPGLTANGVLSPDAAERLRRYYEQQLGGERSWLGIILSAVGALLIGGGVISLLAYNWEHLSRGIRAALAFIPLLIGQAGGSWVALRTDERRVGAREGWAAFWFLAVGACLGLIAQTYHLGGRFDTFLLVWMLLAFPLAFALQAVVPALLAMVGITAWNFMWEDHGGSGLWLWPLGILVVAAVWPVLRREEDSPRATLVTAFAALVFLIAVGFTVSEMGHEVRDNGFAFLLFLSAGAALYMLDAVAVASRWHNLLKAPGRVGALVVLVGTLILTYYAVWRDDEIGSLGVLLSKMKSAGPMARAVALTVLAVTWAVVAIGWRGAVRQGQWAPLWLGSAPMVLVMAMMLERPIAAVVLLNVYVLAAGVAGIALGVRERNGRRAYTGLAAVVLLIAFRFFDVDVGFVTRGVVFIILGIAFLVAQRVMARCMREVA